MENTDKGIQRTEAAFNTKLLSVRLKESLDSIVERFLLTYPQLFFYSKLPPLAQS